MDETSLVESGKTPLRYTIASFLVLSRSSLNFLAPSVLVPQPELNKGLSCKEKKFACRLACSVIVLEGL